MVRAVHSEFFHSSAIEDCSFALPPVGSSFYCESPFSLVPKESFAPRQTIAVKIHTLRGTTLYSDLITHPRLQPKVGNHSCPGSSPYPHTSLLPTPVLLRASHPPSPTLPSPSVPTHPLSPEFRRRTPPRLLLRDPTSDDCGKRPHHRCVLPVHRPTGEVK